LLQIAGGREFGSAHAARDFFPFLQILLGLLQLAAASGAAGVCRPDETNHVTGIFRRERQLFFLGSGIALCAP